MHLTVHVFDVMLLNLNLNLHEGMSFDLLKYVKLQRPTVEVIVISMVDDEQKKRS
jgi:DNA-binding NarL/FixJ family response regulator